MKPHRILPFAVLAGMLLCTATSNAHQAVDPTIEGLILDIPKTRISSAKGRIDKGRDLFLNETFDGNGRTCGTCHEPTRNFTIDPAFIATLPQSSPLFVAENNPDLAGLENPALMRQFGLILENLDGFENSGVMRGVPHTLALRTSIKPRADFPLVNATGWSGDGAPFDGSLRNFAVGAVTQHLTKNLARRPGVDFRVPTKQELDALVEFQLSLGRTKDISLDGDNGPELIFADQNVETGKALFIIAPSRNGTRSCAACHEDAGANDQNGVNRQFDTGTALQANAPACIDSSVPGDGGFGATPVVTKTLACGAQAIFSGNGAFNTAPLVEAADTPPFFHNNSSGTIEGAIEHFTTEVFAASPAGANNPFVLDGTQVSQIGAMLRTVNSMENIRRGIDVDNEALKAKKSDAEAMIAEARSETLDAIRVLNEARIQIYQGTSIIALLQQAADLEAQAIDKKKRKTSLQSAIAAKQQALAQFTQ